MSEARFAESDMVHQSEILNYSHIHEGTYVNLPTADVHVTDILARNLAIANKLRISWAHRLTTVLK